MKPLVIVTEPLAPEPLLWLSGECEVVQAAPGQAKFVEAAGRASGLAIRTATRVDERLLSQLPNLKVVARAGVGLDHVDLAACKARGVRVVHTPDANTQAVVEYVLALVLETIRPRVFLSRAVDADQWETARVEHTASRQLNEMTFGILGLGRIGKRLARSLRALDCGVVYNDVLPMDPADRHGAEPVTARELFQRADILSIHIDGRDSNRHFIDAGLIHSMKSDTLLVNTSRGRVMDHAALAVFLRVNPRARALLDVHDPEPFSADSPLLGLANARLSPHIASRTHSAVLNMSWVVRDLVAVLSNRAPQFQA